MSRPKSKAVRSFALKLETLERLRQVTSEVNLAGGASAVAEDAIASWLRKYTADPKGWLAARGIAHTTEPAGDDI